nr:gephyrin-like molybdotransferase Glp [Allostreptomyces psammosilenae]
MPGASGAGRLEPVERHLERVLSAIRPLAPLDMQVLDAHGCLLAEDVTAPGNVPPFDNSSMDGYAVRAADLAGAERRTPVVLTVLGDVPAGASDLPRITPGTCARIMTGAPMPPGADSVVPVEWTDGGSGGDAAADTMAPATAAPVLTGPSGGPAGDGGGRVRVFRQPEYGSFVRRSGSDVERGEVVLSAGTVLTPSRIGLLCAVRRNLVKVRPRPRVSILSTGSELTHPADEPVPGRIPDANSFMLTAAAREAGALAFRAGCVPDDPAELTETLEDQLIRSDLVVTSGGVSVGAYDVVKQVFADLGEVSFHRLAMQPGKPQGFGTIGPDATPLFALPGNPVSAFVSFELFVRPAIRRMMGMEQVHRPVVRARLDAPITGSPEGRRQYARGRYVPPMPGEITGTVTPVGGSGSHLLGALARANALVVVDEWTTSAPMGQLVDVMLLQE